MQSCISERVFYSSRRQRLHDADIIQSLYLAALFLYPNKSSFTKTMQNLLLYCNKILVINDVLRKFCLTCHKFYKKINEPSVLLWIFKEMPDIRYLPFEWQKWETNVLLPWLSNKNKGWKQVNTAWERVMIVMVCKLKVKKCHFTQKWALQKMR